MTRDEAKALKDSLVAELRQTGTIAERVARRYAFKYEPKEKKQTKVDRVMRFIRDETGLSRGLSEQIADALVRGREVERLAIQKGWPIEDGTITGPQGSLELGKVPL